MRGWLALSFAVVSAQPAAHAWAQGSPAASPSPEPSAGGAVASASPAPADAQSVVPPPALPAPPPAAAPSPAPPRPSLLPPRLPADQIRARERLAMVSLSTVVLAQKTYAAMNRSLFDSMTCLMKPGECIPGQADAAPVLDPSYQWLEPRLGYVMRFHPGPGATDEEIRRLAASPSSIRAFAVTLTPEHPGLTGGRAFCGDSTGRMCFTDGAAPPVKDGRCEPCKKLQ